MSDTQNLSTGDFVYQADRELFLVVTGETETAYQFAAYGWRDIDKERLDEYLSHENAKLNNSDDVIDYVENNGNDETKEQFTNLLEMFQAHADEEYEDGFPHENFTLNES